MSDGIHFATGYVPCNQTPASISQLLNCLRWSVVSLDKTVGVFDGNRFAIECEARIVGGNASTGWLIVFSRDMAICAFACVAESEDGDDLYTLSALDVMRIELALLEADIGIIQRDLWMMVASMIEQYHDRELGSAMMRVLP